MNPNIRLDQIFNSFSVLEVCTTSTGTIMKLSDFVRKSKKEIIKKNIVTGNSIEDLQKYFYKNQVVCLVITGKSVIIKTYPPNNTDKEIDISHYFPGLDPETVSYHNFIQKDSPAILSITRNSNIEAIVTSLADHNVFLVNLYIGPAVVMAAIQNGIDLVREIIAGPYIIKTNGDIVQDIIQQETICTIQENSENNPGEMVDYLSEGVARAFCENLTVYRSTNEIINKYNSEYNAYKKIKKLFYLSVILIFTLTFTNFIILKKYSEKLSKLKLSDKYLSISSTIKAELEEKIKRAEYFVSISNPEQNTKFSKIADRVAVGLPAEIQLTKMILNPQSNLDNGNSNSIVFSDSIIVIEGLSKSSSGLIQFTNFLRKQTWVKDLQFADYRQNSDMTSASFKVELQTLIP